MAGERKGFTVKWKIENFYSWDLFLNNPLCSPRFLLNKAGDTSWKLKLDLVGSSGNIFDVALSLVREEMIGGPSEILLDVQLSALASDESPLTSREFRNISFSKKSGSLLLILNKYILQFQERLDLQDLTFCCRLWHDPTPVSEGGDCIAMTRIGEKLNVFNVVLEHFSALHRGQERRAFIQPLSEETVHVCMNISLTMEENIEIVALKTHGGFKNTCFFKLFLLDTAGIREECMEPGLWLGNFNDFTFSPKLTKKRLLDSKERYLPNDALTLCFEMKSTAGIEVNEIDKPEYRSESPRTTRRKSSDQKKVNNSFNPQALTTTLKDDLMSMYRDRIFCDTTLRSGTETFPAHRIVLGARSPVFKAMFTHDMREKADDCVDIPDLSSDTIRRMLLFLYTDTTEDLDWDNAKDLYFAADKYEILSLKKSCSSFLEENICTANVCDILELADVHQDSALKGAMQNFILRHDKEVFGSKEWKMFINSNAKLAAETMCLKYI